MFSRMINEEYGMIALNTLLVRDISKFLQISLPLFWVEFPNITRSV